MHDPHDPSTDDRERLQRYLEWREHTDRTPRRGARPRGVVVGGAVVGTLAIVASIGWLTLGPRALPDSASTSGQGSPSAGVPVPSNASPDEAPAPAPIERAPAPRPRSVQARRTARSEAPPAREPESRAETAELAGEAATSRMEPAPAPPAPPIRSTPDVIAPSAAMPAAVDAKAACAAVTASDGGVRPRSRRAVECVGGWLKGQAREARDGVRREIDDFRAGVDRVGRGLQALGDKLRRAE
jgi:hypothetical protein